jgi:membrane protein DedA with SNARE-associated domain
MPAVAVLAAIAGDSVGYEVGRHFGTRLLETRIFARHRRRSTTT